MPVEIQDKQATVTIVPQVVREITILPVQASVSISDPAGAVVEIAAQSELVLQQVIPSGQPSVEILSGAPDVVVLLEPNRGADGATGTDGADDVWQRVNTDHDGTWLVVFYIQDTRLTTQWRIFKIDAAGDETKADYLDFPALTPAQAWTQRLTLTYT